MKSICNSIDNSDYENDINYYHFVFETELKKLKQPFCFNCFYLFLVVRGSGNLKINDKIHPLKTGTLFFAFPQTVFTIHGSDDFSYLYISFSGIKVNSLLNKLNITKENFIFHKNEHLITFWMNSIRRIYYTNGKILTESVFLYTLSYIDGKQMDNHVEENSFEYIIEFINQNLSDESLSLKKVAGIFFYNEKYLSMLFKKNMRITFSKYVNNIRIEYAYKLINDGNNSIKNIAKLSGFSDSSYFSKVFKNFTGVSPLEYIKNKNCNKI